MAWTNAQNLYCMYVICEVESGWNWAATNRQDAITLGIGQWWGTRAAGLMDRLRNQAPTSYAKLSSRLRTKLETDGPSAQSWTAFYLNQEDAKSWADSAGDSENHQIQQALFLEDIEGYKTTLASWGLDVENNVKATIYWMSAYHQNPSFCNNVMGAVGDNTNLSTIRSGILSHRVLGQYPNRYNTIYERLTAWDGVSAPPDFGQVDEFQEGLSPTAQGSNMAQAVTGIRYLQRRGDNIMVFSEDYPQGMMCVKTNGDLWVPFTSNTQVEMPNTEEGITGGSPSLFEQCKQTWIDWANAGGFGYGGDGASDKYPETSGNTSCAACIWAALNKHGSDICDWMAIYCPDLQKQGKLIYHTTGYNDIRVPIEQMLPGDLILMDYGGNGRADHVDWYFGNGVVWGAGSAPCPHHVSDDAEHYLQGRSRSIVVELWIVRIFDEE